MKLAHGLILLASAPLSAQTSPSQNTVVNVVVTYVKAGTSTPVKTVTLITPVLTLPSATPTSLIPVVPSPMAASATPAVNAAGAATSCIDNYPGAVKAIGSVSTSLLELQQLYASALSAGQIDSSTYNAGTNTLSLVRRDSSDVRDLMRLAGPTDLVAQNITFVSAEISTFPKLLGSPAGLSSSLSTLVTSMESSLTNAKSLVTASSCPQSMK